MVKFGILLAQIFACCVLLVTFNSLAHAQEEFTTSIAENYLIHPDGLTTVTNIITLKNNFSTLHAVSYTFTLLGNKRGFSTNQIKNVTAVEDNYALPFITAEDGDKTNIVINFPNAVVGKGKERTFTLQYDTSSIATKNGAVWSISIPKLEKGENFINYQVRLIVPKDFGQIAYISPKPEQVVGDSTYIFSKEQLTQTGVVAAFGKFQIFNFSLKYHLKNITDKAGVTEIALPPDTAFQRVYYNEIDPKPISIKTDLDGNWLASYKLNKNQQIDVITSGEVQIFAAPQEFYTKNMVDIVQYTKGDQYWDVHDPRIQVLAKDLKTPKEIYNYVVKTLDYDYNRAKPGAIRLGAKTALDQSKSALCMEFTDLFVTFARAAGIPAREVNGFAYTENLQIQPRSLVTDVLHSWPEFWDEQLQTWHPVDPTWEKTTGGVDYFSKFDLNHIAFAMHGQKSTEPLPAGFYKLNSDSVKDVSISFGSLPESNQSLTSIKTENLILSVQTDKKLSPFSPIAGILTISNQGSTAQYLISPIISSSFGKINLKQKNIPFLAPLDSISIPFTWDTDPLITHTDMPRMTVLADKTKITYTVPRENILWELASLFAGLLMVTGALFILLITRKQAFYIILRIIKYINHHVRFKNHPHKSP